MDSLNRIRVNILYHLPEGMIYSRVFFARTYSAHYRQITFIVGDLGAPFVGYSMTVMLYPSCHGYPDIISLGCIDDVGYIIFEHINSCGSIYHWRSFLHLEPQFLDSFHDISEVDGDNDVDGGSDNGDNSDYSNDGRSGGGIGVHDESYAIWPDHGTVAAFRPMIPVFIHVYGLDRVFHAPPLLLPYNVYTAHYLRISVCLRPIAGAPPNSYNRTMIIYPSCHDHPDIISIDAISDREVFQFEHISYCQSRHHLRSFRNILEPVLNPHHPPPDGNGRGGGSSGGHRGAGNGGRGIGFLNNNRSNHGGPVTFLPPHPFEDASGSHNDVRDRSGYGLRGALGQADLISHFSNGGGEIGLPDKHQCEVKQEKLQDNKSAVFEVPTIMHNESEQPKAWNEISSQEAKRQSIAVITAWQLNERMYGELQGLNKQGTADRFGKEKVHEWLCSYDITPPNGKSIEMRAERAVAYFKEHVSIIVHYESELAKAWSEFFHAERKHQASPVTTACQLNEIMSIAASSTYGELQFLNKQETADIFDKQKVQECCCNYDLPSPNRNSLLICTERDLSYFKKHAVPQLLAVKHLIIASHESSLRSIIMFLVKLASQEVINLEIWTGVPMHYIFKEGKFIGSGSPVALSESSIYACARSKPQLLTVMVAAYGNSLRSILPDLERLTSQEVKDSEQSIGILALYIIMEGKSLENRSLVAPSKAAGLASGICMSVLSSAAAPND